MQANLSLGPDPIVFQETIPSVRFCGIPFLSNRQIDLPVGNGTKHSYNSDQLCIDLYNLSIPNEINIGIDMIEPSIQLVVVLKGNTLILQNGRKISSLSKNNFCLSFIDKGKYQLLVNSGILSILIITINSNWLRANLIKFPKFRPFLNLSLTRKHSILGLPSCSMNRHLVKAFNISCSLNNKAQINIDSIISKFLLRTLKAYQNSLSEKRYSTKTLHLIKSIELRKLIHSHFKSKTVNDNVYLAKTLCISEQTLKRISKDIFNMPLNQYIIDYRMRQAMKLLLTTNIKINSIAYSVGYTDSHYFSRAFKKRYGMAPKAIVQIKLSDLRTPDSFAF